MGAYTYSGTAASNTTVDGIGAAGSDSPDNIDNLIRALAASDANLQKDLAGFNTTGGTADAITITLADATAITNYTDKMIGFVAASDNATTSPTLNVDSVGAEPIKKAVAGVETALAAGDIQGGGYYLVRWRSTWDGGGGAWELLDPSAYTLPASPSFTAPQITTIELGHASDTTLSRSAAGVMAVEANVVPSPASQAQYDMLVRGASSWDRLAIGTAGQHLVVRSGTPTWSNVSTFDTVQASTSGSAINFTSIPSWVKEIDVLFDAVSLSGSDSILVQIGDSGGLETSGYVASSTNANSSGNTSSTAGFVIRRFAAGDSHSGIMRIVNITGNVWVSSHTAIESSSAGIVGAGTKTLSATLDRLTVLPSGANTFDAGQINICYR